MFPITTEIVFSPVPPQGNQSWHLRLKAAKIEIIILLM